MPANQTVRVARCARFVAKPFLTQSRAAFEIHSKRPKFKERRTSLISSILQSIFHPEPLRQSGSRKKKKVIAFVDFEHWYISLSKLYHARPDIKAFRDELSEQYEIVDIKFFGDFSNPSLRAEISAIRQISNTIIDTQNASDRIEKDFTDFIILDHIYQSAMNAGQHGVEAYVIFTGDGHFSSATSFLVTKCRKEVGIYAVRGAASRQLIDCATYARLLPDETSAAPTAVVQSRTGSKADALLKHERCAKLILQNLSELYAKSGKKQIYPTFWATVEAVVRHRHTDRSETAAALRELIAAGYIYQTAETIPSGKKKKGKTPDGEDDSVKVLHVNWSAAEKDHLI